MGAIRINELARELEVKSRRILDYLPEIGVTEKKSHSSSIEEETANRVRAHFRAVEQAEQAAERRAAEARAKAKAAEREAAERAAAEKAAAERAAQQVAAERAAAEKAAAPDQAVPARPTEAQLTVETQPPAPRTLPRPPGARPSTARPAAAPSAQKAAGVARPAVRRPGAPRPVQAEVPTPPAPGKPIYQRKVAARARPAPKTHKERRFEEGERRFLHPVRLRARAERGAPRRVREALPVPRAPMEIVVNEGMTVKELAEKLDLRAKEVIKVLFDRGMLVTINQSLDSALAIEVAKQFNATAKVVSFEEQSVQELIEKKAEGKQVARAPVITVMGHVDHGKTLLLDAIRETDVISGEAGGITQHIGAYQVTFNGRKIVFIDTPGHEAFTRMRARGAKVTDAVVLVVAADDGVMPQTLEAIDHARAAQVPILVAINKIDKPQAMPDRVKKQLADRGLMPEGWGGDTVMVEVSAKEKTNLEQLLEMILLVTDLKELRATRELPASGVVLEAKIDRGRGPVPTVLVQDGTLRVGDPFIVGSVFGKVRALFDDYGRPIKEAGPSTPVEVLGLTGLPEAGDPFQVVTDEVKAKQVASYRGQKSREAALISTSRLTLDHLQEQLRADETKELPLILKADVQGSVEALAGQLERIGNDKVKVKILHSGVGGISETDVLLATASNAVIIGFNVRPDRKAAELAQREEVEIRQHNVIYEVVDEITRAASGLLEPTLKEKIVGRAEVRETFRIPRVGMVAGCYVLDGKINRDARVRVLRDNVVVYDSKVASLRRFKDDVKEVQAGYECGVTVSNFADIKNGDVLEVYEVERVAVAVAGPS